MKAVVTWAAPDGSTQPMVIKGARIVTQLWDGGRAMVTVYDRRRRKTRVVHLAHVSVIDKDRRRGRG